MFVEENSASIYLQGMRDRSMRSGTKFAREIQLTDWSTAGNLSNRSSGVRIPRDICTRFGRYLYSTRCSWIINLLSKTSVDDIEWICQSCNNHLKKNKIPPCATKNGMSFTVKPDFFYLNELECRLLAPRLAFQKLMQAPRGNQLKRKGNIVNVPADVNNTVNVLPRLPQ